MMYFVSLWFNRSFTCLANRHNCHLRDYTCNCTGSYSCSGGCVCSEGSEEETDSQGNFSEAKFQGASFQGVKEGTYAFCVGWENGEALHLYNRCANNTQYGIPQITASHNIVIWTYQLYTVQVTIYTTNLK